MASIASAKRSLSSVFSISIVVLVFLLGLACERWPARWSCRPAGNVLGLRRVVVVVKDFADLPAHLCKGVVHQLPDPADLGARQGFPRRQFKRHQSDGDFFTRHQAVACLLVCAAQSADLAVEVV